MSENLHIPVLAEELIASVPLKDSDGVYLDGTFGLGGHSRYLSRNLPSNAMIIGLEWDDRLEEYHKKIKKNSSVKVFYDNYSQFDFVLASQGIQSLNGVLLDLGFSSVHIDEASMGFSFQQDSPLDMRYSRELKQDAGMILNKTSEKELGRIFFRYGEEPLSKKVARAIVKRRSKRPFETTQDFVRFLQDVFPSQKGYPWKGIRKTFQSLRIVVNKELVNLENFLKKITCWLFQENDWIAIISYHSLEDRMVKRHFTSLTQACVCPKEEPVCRCDHIPEYEWIEKIIKPSSKEVEENPRSASARLRIIRRKRGF